MTTTNITIGPDTIETRDDLPDGDLGTYDYWMGQEDIADKEEDKWPDRSREIIKRYRDERGSAGNAHRFNILWSNVQTLLPTYYARTPKPEVSRRYLDKDDTGRLASILLERAIEYSLDPAGGSPFDAMMRAAVLDCLLPGRGTGRVLYVPHYGDELPGEDDFENAQDESSEVDNSGDEGDLREVVDEEVTVKYVYWEDYREGPARTWEEVPWVRYRAYMTRDELVERFGKKKGMAVVLDYPKTSSRRGREADQPAPDIFKKAVVHEYWDKASRRVIWIAPATHGMVLDEKDDPLRLPDFFPSPDPLLATTTTDKRIPVPDYAEYRDQAKELDRITTRIDMLTQACKVAGVYPGEQKQVLQQLLDPNAENRLVPVEDWVAFAKDMGGMREMIQWLPIEQIAAALQVMYDARDRTKQILYELTGIGDILRGETVPDETATAQQLKSNFATRRIVPKQKEVARFARDMIRLMGAVIAEHFDARTISRMTGYPQLLPVPELPPAPPQWMPDPQEQQQMAPQPPANDAGPPPDRLPQQEGEVVHYANGTRLTRRGGQVVRVA